jgi:hypothetical protein
LDTCPFFQFFLLHSHMFLFSYKIFLRDNNKDFKTFIWWKPKWNIFGVSFQCRSKTFWMEQDGMVWVVVGVVWYWF